ncbi:hypothetical protein B0H17DRAFT_1124713 [Mycena rosella]|uniref:Uncharacterized protein n=1 Tax=Mycena rosella TaxID=1033263 RepID=A0AAD7GZN7_MYCRO|nr:hypothetical protein B0H17DRAFT_1124713 [Mycena rosella]
MFLLYVVWAVFVLFAEHKLLIMQTKHATDRAVRRARDGHGRHFDGSATGKPVPSGEVEKSLRDGTGDGTAIVANLTVTALSQWTNFVILLRNVRVTRDSTAFITEKGQNMDLTVDKPVIR